MWDSLGDGFGVGWYEPDVVDSETANTPCIFTSVTPAWNNNNLIRLAEKIKSPLVFAHVRASTAGTVTETNCHPFQYGLQLITMAMIYTILNLHSLQIWPINVDAQRWSCTI